MSESLRLTGISGDRDGGYAVTLTGADGAPETGAPEPGGAPLVARTLREAYLYLELTLPGGGEIAYGVDAKLHERPDGGHVLRYDGQAGGWHRRLAIEIPRDEVTQDAYGIRSYGPGRSTLLDAGQWALTELVQLNVVIERLRALDGAAPSAASYQTVVRAFESAAGAVDEILKLLPDGGGRPEDAVWTDQGRAFRREHPESFDGERLVAAAAEHRRDLATFTDRWGR